VLVLVAVDDELLLLRFIRASVGSAGLNPSTLANKFKISVNDTTPCNLPINNPGAVTPTGGAVTDTPTMCGAVPATGTCIVTGDEGPGAAELAPDGFGDGGSELFPWTIHIR